MNDEHQPFQIDEPAPAGTPQPAVTPAVHKSVHYDLFLTILAWAAWAAGYMLCVVIPVTKCLFGAFAMEVVLFVGALVLVGCRNRLCLARGTVIAVFCVMLSAAFLVTTNQAIQVCVFLFTAVSWFYMVFVLSGSSEERFPGDRFLRETCRSVLVTPFNAPGSLFQAIFSGRQADGTPRKARFGHIFGMIMLGLGAAVVPTIIVAVLLSYDKGFSDLIERIFDFTIVGHFIHRSVVGLLIASLMFGALLYALHKPDSSQKNDDLALRTGGGSHVAPVIVSCAALFPLLVLYVIFFISQWDYYMSAFTGVLPDGLTYAAYAREGFFQLCAVAGINAGLAVLAAVFTKRRAYDPEKPDRDRVPPALRVALSVLSLFTLVLIATAVSKMVLYVDAFGLTQKRVYAAWFMLLLAVAFIVVLIRQVWHRMNLIGTLLCVFLVFFLAISVVNVDGMIVSYNVDRCLEGNISTMQGERDSNKIEVLEDAGVSAVLPALRFMDETADSTDPDVQAIREKTEKFLQKQADRLDGASFWEKNFVGIRAERALRDRAYMDHNQIQ